MSNNEDHRRARLARFERAYPPSDTTESSEAMKDTRNQAAKTKATSRIDGDKVPATITPTNADTKDAPTMPDDGNKQIQMEKSPSKDIPSKPHPTAETIQGNATNVPSGRSQENKKKRRLLASPSTILSQALSHVLGRNVVMLVQGDTCNDKKTKAGTIVLRLPFQVSNNDDEQDWTRLADYFVDKCIPNQDIWKMSNLLLHKQHVVPEAAACHSRIQVTLRDGWMRQKHAQLNRCLQAVSLHIVMPRVAQALIDDMQAMYSDDDDDTDDLFAEDYTALSNTASTDRPVDTRLLEAPTPAVTSAFLNDLFQQEGGDTLTSFLFQHLLGRLKPTLLSYEEFQQRLTSVSNMLSLAPSAASQVMAARIASEQELSQRHDTGCELEKEVMWLAPLFSAAAYGVPWAGSERANAATKSSIFARQLQDLPQFPICIFQQSNLKEYNIVLNDSRRTMANARRVAESALRVTFRKADKALVFQWLRRIADSNEAMASLAKPDLLAVDGVTATCASRSFLLGASSTLVQFCSQNLIAHFTKKGANAFDALYMARDDRDCFFQSDTSPLFIEATEKPIMQTNQKFSGATEFFFLSCALLRVSLYPFLRMQDEFLQLYHKALCTVESAAHDAQSPPTVAVQQLNPIVATWLGFKLFLEDPDYVSTMTDFALLQLGWLQAVATDGDAQLLACIPDWMCKEPSRWLSVATRQSWHLIKPHQAEKAVEVAIGLLQSGMCATSEEARAPAFSPVVITALIRIAASCVQAGVDRARQLQNRQRRRSFGKPAKNDEPEDDDEDIDIYLSFDQHDLGVTVFTNQRVQSDLCPTLMEAFQSLDIVEGLDVDREHAFDKFAVKLEIVDLFLRLWSHPNGECRKSVLKVAPIRLAKFASSISAAIGYLLDDACLRMADVCKFSNRSKSQFQSERDKRYEETQTSAAVSNFAGARKLLLLLMRLSQEQSLASIFGGCMDGSKDRMEVTTASDLAVMVIHFLDLMTSEDGGTHADLEYQRDASDSTAALLACEIIMTKVDKDVLASSVVKSRYLARSRIGFDASIMCHQLLALATKWHLSAAGGRTDAQASPFIMAMAAHDYCDVPRYQKIVERLISIPGRLLGTEVDNARVIFKHDGYVDCANWLEKYESNDDLQDNEKRNSRRARRNQMTRDEISTLSSNKDISRFLAQLKINADLKLSDISSKLVPTDQIPAVEKEVLTSGSEDLSDETYGEILSEWVVSSSPFANRAGNTESFLHYYDSTARRHESSGSGKALIKEARRCHTIIPAPHANSASFLCFAEERMDLCRAIITGPVDTPYSLGIFVFDVYYPLQYPQIPPLVTFMTTGGGQTRFGPNLYQDGKVCLSLLGTFHALDDSERWNPNVSSLAQILLSIQTQLLVKEPYFNEPGAERMDGTKTGKDASARYNSSLRLATLRHAILEPLRNPPLGFEEVTLRHFSMCRKRILIQAKHWMLEAKGSTSYPRFERAYAELLRLLSSSCMQKYESLPPLPNDIAALARLDPSFSYLDMHDDRKPSVSPKKTNSATNVVSSSDADWNPWARSAPAGQGNMEDDPDVDDELYV